MTDRSAVSMSLFSESEEAEGKLHPAPHPAPLADRMRPQKLEDILGQEHAIGPGSALGEILRTPGLGIPSMLFWGPPGTGKTTLARVIAANSGYRFLQLSGVLDGVEEIRKAVVEAKRERDKTGKPTLALVDEIHRFNKSQQDAFLPHMESGLLTVIGQTTENVSFRIRNALLSRLRVIEIKPLAAEQLGTLINRALNDKDHGLGAWELSIEPEAVELLARLSGGDARRALSGLEWSAALVKAEGGKVITLEHAKQSFGNQPALFDQDGDAHYDCISAFIKSMRGSDPDAALYYMVRALEGGEDPLFLTRRMIIFASEDCSCDPRALEIAINTERALERVGLPEGKIPMAQGAVYLACCAKSNASYLALKEMEQLVENNPNLEIPKRLRNAPTDLMREMGNSLGYHYPHDYPGGFVPESYLPEALKDLRVYRPTDRGLDAQIRERLEHYRSLIEAEKHKRGK